MCGIIGWLRCDGAPINRALVFNMTRLLTHRGPDDEGFFSDDGTRLEWGKIEGKCNFISHPFCSESLNHTPSISFGHCRLAIIDLSPAGHQPMSDQSRRYWITYNGEVYNFIELRQELETRGYQFQSQTDTEVVLAAYIEWGQECLKRFNGMWAFAIWDAKERVLFCTRDRFGVKPFYYYWDGRHFIFASEIKTLLMLRAVPRTLSDEIILDYLISGNVDHLPGKTFFKEVRQLLPAHYVLIKDSIIQMRRYWEIQIPERKRPYSEEFVGECRDLILDAIQLRLRSDVPIGGTLSGGIDSATLTCLIDQNLVSNIYHNFSIQFPGCVFDESRYVNDVMLKTKHVQLHSVSPSCEELIADLHKLMWHQDEPFGDTSIYAHYRLMKMAKENGIKVILTGQGGDEVFCGYWSYYRAFLGYLLSNGNIGLFQKEVRERCRITGEHPFMLFSIAVYHALPSILRNKVQSYLLYKRSSWVDIALKRSVIRQHFTPHPQGWSTFDWYLYESLTKWSIPHLLRHDDRNSMAFGVESRVPYLDYRLVQLLFSAKDDIKIKNGQMKNLLRKVGEGIIPSSITERKDKIGFYTPMPEWLTQSSDFIKEVLSSDFAQKNQYFSAKQFLRMVGELTEGNYHFMSPIWWGISLCLWYEVVVNRPYLSEDVTEPVYNRQEVRM